MRVVETLSPDRIRVLDDVAVPSTREGVLRAVADLLAPAVQQSATTVFEGLLERERLRSTGIGHGIAIPHTGLPGVGRQLAALVLSRSGVEFGAIDGEPAYLFFGVVGPERAGGEHLKLLARVSRLLHDPNTRRALFASSTAQELFKLVEQGESDGSGQ